MLELLTAALDGTGSDDVRGAAALRLRVRLQPAAGVGARVMPPTYSGPGERGASIPVYLCEKRRLEDVEVECVTLDSIPSQSNRLEDALLDLIAGGRVRIPDIEVDQQEFGRHSALEFSHRLFDAWIEDALDGEVRFGETPLYARLAAVINRAVARPMIDRFPVGLLLGCWASRKHNPQGSTRLARAITSEIVGFGFISGKRGASKLDLQHVSAEVPLRETPSTARNRYEVVDGPKPKGAKRPSQFGYGNVTPSEASHGGGTVRFAEQQTVVSLAALRAVRAHEPGVANGAAPAADLAARELLALLALAMLEGQVEIGWDLRSGCHLVPEQDPTVELVGRLGNVLASAPLIGLGAVEALAARLPAAAEHGIAWDVPPIELQASPQQLQLLRRSLGLPPDASAE